MIQISEMTINDFEQISPILSSEFDDFWNENLLKSELQNPNSKSIVAKDEKQILGFACIWKAYDVMHVTNIVVKKTCRRTRYW